MQKSEIRKVLKSKVMAADTKYRAAGRRLPAPQWEIPGSTGGTQWQRVLSAVERELNEQAVPTMALRLDGYLDALLIDVQQQEGDSK